MSKSSSATFQLVFHEDCSTCRYIFDVFVRGDKLHILLLCHLEPIPLCRFFRMLGLALGESVAFRWSAFNLKILIPRIKVNTLETLQCACILFFSSFFLHWIYSQCPLYTSSSTFHSVNNVRWTLRLSFIFINIIYQN